jgi:hypothetical protein
MYLAAADGRDRWMWYIDPVARTVAEVHDRHRAAPLWAAHVQVLASVAEGQVNVAQAMEWQLLVRQDAPLPPARVSGAAVMGGAASTLEASVAGPDASARAGATPGTATGHGLSEQQLLARLLESWRRQPGTGS